MPLSRRCHYQRRCRQPCEHNRIGDKLLASYWNKDGGDLQLATSSSSFILRMHIHQACPLYLLKKKHNI